MKRLFLVTGLAGALVGGVAFAQGSSAQGQQNQQQPLLPSGAKLVSTAQATEVRVLPELQKGATGEEIVGAKAIDRIYESTRSYKDTVSFFDNQVKSGSATQLSRATTKTATGWSLQLSDGRLQNVVVRNTQPTTIEIVQAAGAVGEETIQRNIQPGQGGSMNQPSGSQGGSMNQPSGSQGGSMNQPSGSQGSSGSDINR